MKDLTDGNIYKSFLFFAIPLILAGFLSQAYSIIDTIIAGKILSADGLSAIGSTSAFIQFFSSIFWGYGVGFSISLAQLFCTKESEKLKTAIIVFGLLAVCFKDPLFSLLKVDPSIYDAAAEYFSIYMLGSVFLLMMSNGLYIMNAFGSGSYPLFMSIVSTALHIGGNLFAVKVLNLGVGGIALSTVFSAIVVDILYIVEINRSSPKYSFPAMLQQMLMYFASVVISPMVNGISSAASAAYIINLKVYDVTATIYQNSAKTLSNYTAQSLGAKKYQNIKRGLKVGVIQGLAFTLPSLALTVIFAREFCAFFLPSGFTGEALEMAIIFARYCMPFVLLNFINNLFHSFYRGVAAMKLLVSATLIGSASRIIATYFAVKSFGMNGVYIGWAISWLVECIYTLIMYFSGIWIPAEMKEYYAHSSSAHDTSAVRESAV